MQVTPHPFRYALVNRPAGIGCVPPKLVYSIMPRPDVGKPHYEMARHGILCTYRELTNEELRSFELAPIIDVHLLEDMAVTIAHGSMAEFAAEYIEVQRETPEDFRGGVLQAVGQVQPGIRYSIGDKDKLVDLVGKHLAASVEAAAHRAVHDVQVG